MNKCEYYGIKIPYGYSICSKCDNKLDDYLNNENNQDEDLGGTGHGDISYSDADEGL